MGMGIPRCDFCGSEKNVELKPDLRFYCFKCHEGGGSDG